MIEHKVPQQLPMTKAQRILLLFAVALLHLASSFTLPHVDRPFLRKHTVVTLATKPRNENEDEKDIAQPESETAQQKAKEQPPNSMSLVEYAERERQAAKNLQNRLLLPNQIGKAINIALYTFVIVGFLLELNGYAYVRTENGISIGTLQDRQFQEEMNRVIKKPGGVDHESSL